MPIVDLLFNAAGGGILGSALHCFTDWLDTKNKIALMKAQVDAAEKAEGWRAFQLSQSNSPATVVPVNTPPWASALFICVDAVKQLARPLLTLAAVLIIAYVYGSATPESRQAMQSEIIFGSFTAVFWYFGARYSRASK